MTKLCICVSMSIVVETIGKLYYVCTYMYIIIAAVSVYNWITILIDWLHWYVGWHVYIYTLKPYMSSCLVAVHLKKERRMLRTCACEV